MRTTKVLPSNVVHKRTSSQSMGYPTNKIPKEWQTKQLSVDNQEARLGASNIFGRSIVGRVIDKTGQGGAITS